MTHIPSRSELRVLMEQQTGLCISLFLPTERAGVDTQQNPPRLGDAQAPLILAGVAYLFPLYREANTYPHLLEEGVPGNPDRVSLETLHKQAWTIVGPSFLQARQEASARYREYAATGRASHTVREIVPAAYDGRVESLFLETEQEHGGPSIRRPGCSMSARKPGSTMTISWMSPQPRRFFMAGRSTWSSARICLMRGRSRQCCATDP